MFRFNACFLALFVFISGASAGEPVLVQRSLSPEHSQWLQYSGGHASGFSGATSERKAVLMILDFDIQNPTSTCEELHKAHLDMFHGRIEASPEIMSLTDCIMRLEDKKAKHWRAQMMVSSSDPSEDIERYTRKREGLPFSEQSVHFEELSTTDLGYKVTSIIHDGEAVEVKDRIDSPSWSIMTVSEVWDAVMLSQQVINYQDPKDFLSFIKQYYGQEESIRYRRDVMPFVDALIVGYNITSHKKDGTTYQFDFWLSAYRSCTNLPGERCFPIE